MKTSREESRGMFMRIGTRIINLDQVVDAEIREALPERIDEETGETLRAKPLQVIITTTAVESHYDDGGDFPDSRHANIHARIIFLSGGQAELFLAAIPTCTPLPEDDEPDVDDDFPVELEYDDNRF